MDTKTTIIKYLDTAHVSNKDIPTDLRIKVMELATAINEQYPDHWLKANAIKSLIDLNNDLRLLSLEQVGETYEAKEKKQEKHNTLTVSLFNCKMDLVMSDGGKANHPKFDGYISWSPKDVFEKSYKANGSLGFSEAHSIALSEDSTRIARSGWNGAELSVYYVTPENGLERHMVIRNGKTGRINTWVPSSADLTANDWSIL